MPANPKYKSLDDILSALKDEDQSTEESVSQTDEDLPKQFPSREESSDESDSHPRRPSAAEIAEIADELDQEDSKPAKPIRHPAKEVDEEEDQEEDEDNEDSDGAEFNTAEEEPEDRSESEQETDKPAEEEPEDEPEDSPKPTEDSKPKSTWRTSPANLKSNQLFDRKEPDPEPEDEDGDSLPESLRDERPKFDVPAKPAARERWADFPEYPVERKTEPETPASFESNLSDLVDRDETNQSDEEGMPIRRIDHSVNNRFNQRSNGSGLEDDSFGSSPSRGFDYNIGDNRKNRKWQYLIILLVALITIAAVVFMLKNQYIPFIGSPSNVVITSPSPTPEPSPSPTPTPEPELNRSGFKIRVLNGTTTTGLASSVADKLKALGYQIGKVGNNSSQSVDQTFIRVKPNEASVGAQLVKDLTGQFTASVSGDLKATDTDDAEVVIGSK